MLHPSRVGCRKLKQSSLTRLGEHNRYVAWTTSKSAGKMRLIRLMFLLLVAVSIIASMAFAHWESRLIYGNETFILDLPPSSIWVSPPVPDYSKFEALFNDLPELQPVDSRIGNFVRWDSVFLSFAACIAGIGLIAVPVAVLSKSRDRFLFHLTCISIGLFCGFVGSFVFWLIIGGWGPPFLVFFAVVGMFGGYAVGAITQRRIAT